MIYLRNIYFLKIKLTIKPDLIEQNELPYISADKTIAESYKKVPKIRDCLIRQIQRKLD